MSRNVWKCGDQDHARVSLVLQKKIDAEMAQTADHPGDHLAEAKEESHRHHPALGVPGTCQSTMQVCEYPGEGTKIGTDWLQNHVTTSFSYKLTILPLNNGAHSIPRRSILAPVSCRAAKRSCASTVPIG